MHIYKSRFLVRGEVWFNHQPDRTPVDWIVYRQRSNPVRGARWQYFYTILVDLGQSPETLQQQMHSSTAYKVRRARDKDKVVCRSLTPVSRQALDGFEESYRRFAAVKGLSALDRALLDQLAEDGVLELSCAKSPAGETLAEHAYYRDSNRSCLLHSVSLYQTLADSGARNAMGRANRYLYWCDMVRHQEHGLRFFDFGGWYPGATNHELLEINRFKEGFGGKVVREYNCEQIMSLKGRVVLTIAAWLRWVRGCAACWRPSSRTRVRPSLGAAGRDVGGTFGCSEGSLVAGAVGPEDGRAPAQEVAAT
jgi:hypothetical protein